MAALGPLLIAHPALAGSCEQDLRPQTFAVGIVRFTSYLCGFSAADPTRKLRITAYRLHERLAGSILKEAPLPETTALFGQPTLIRNDVFKAGKDLFDRFGIRQQYADDSESAANIAWTLLVNGKVADDQTYGLLSTDSASKPARTSWSISDLNSDNTISSVFEKEHQEVLKTTRWPAAFNQFLKPCKKDFIDCMILWKYISADRLEPILQEIREARRIAEERARADEEQANAMEATEADKSGAAIAGSVKTDADPKVARENATPDYERHFALFKYLLQGAWPEDYLTARINVTGDECLAGDDFASWSFRYYPRPLALDVLMIENESSTEVVIEELLGRQASGTALRPLPKDDDAAAAGQSVSLRLGRLSLPPKGRLLIPTALTFLDGTGQVKPRYETVTAGAGRKVVDKTRLEVLRAPGWRSLREAEKTYKAIKAYKRDVLTKEETSYEGEKEIKTIIRKERSAFLPPQLPEVKSFRFGPEISVLGLSVGGESVVLPGSGSGAASLNDIDLTLTDLPEGSCPILSWWSEADGGWVRRGKVLHRASSADKRMTERVRVPNGLDRFRLAEEEPEVTYLVDLRLALTFADGTVAEFAPKEPYTRIILADRHIDIAFDLTTAVAGRQVVRAELVLTGHYERYSTILAARR